jgi:hypothetical protein
MFFKGETNYGKPCRKYPNGKVQERPMGEAILSRGMWHNQHLQPHKLPRSWQKFIKIREMLSEF